MPDPLSSHDALSQGEDVLAATMTHGPDQPGPLKSFVDYAKQPAPQQPIQPFEEKINQAISRQDPRYVPAQPPQQQNWQQWVEQALNLPFGFLGSIEWTPEEIARLKMMYSANIKPSELADLIKKYLPGRSPLSVRGKSFQLGLKRPEIPPYVRQPGTPLIANDPKKSELIQQMVNDNFTNAEIAARLGISDKTVRRYINENLKYRKVHSGQAFGGQAPSMPSFNLPGEAAGDPDYEKALAQFLSTQQPRGQ